MKKIVILLVLFSLIASPLYAINIFNSLIYKQVQIGTEIILVNRVTDKVSKKLVNGRAEPIPEYAKEMYQTYYERIKEQERAVK